MIKKQLDDKQHLYHNKGVNERKKSLKKSLKSSKRGEIYVDSSKLCARIMSGDLWDSKDPTVLKYKDRMFSEDCPRDQRIIFGDMVDMTEHEVHRIFDENTANELIKDSQEATENLKHLY